MHYFVHNGYVGWAYGTPGDPQLISNEDAEELMRRTRLSLGQVKAEFPPAQFAEKGEPLFRLFNENRFLQYGTFEKCGDVKQSKISRPLKINWNEI